MPSLLQAAETNLIADGALTPRPFPPPWCCAWGDDQYGLWADFAVNSVVQRMRWIEPGQFLMGSSSYEEGRYGDEGPQHRVSISRGFWLADTACTQALWQAVMGDNPSAFYAQNRGGPLHPVEQVSWNTVCDFLRTLQTRLPLCLASLPTEAEWEYACRAGTNTPFFFGKTISSQQANYAGNAWGNGKEGQFREQTVAVKALPANAWGLYQMHGNVWEWCADNWRDYAENPMPNPGLDQALAIGPGIRDGAGPDAASTARVVRGGGWRSLARSVRTAYRNHREPGRRDDSLGFRLALRSQSQASRV
ncbi:MAG: hypothetical protein RL748_392 [Pseudomonadota bacterium]|jgi:formylglycine-generating enzyme required for sulfatase activity